MRILHIVEAFCGGVLETLQCIVNGMGDEHQTYILHAIRNTTPKDVDRVFKSGTVLIHSEHLVRDVTPTEDFLAMQEIKKTVKTVQPDIVHLHSTKAGILGRWALNGRQVKVFYTPHGYSFLMDNCNALKRMLYYEAEKISGYRRCMTIACGRGEYQYSQKVSRRTAYVCNGVDTDQLDSYGFEPVCRDSSMSICTLARISDQKNPELFNEIAKRYPEIRFIWIGDGELRSKLTSSNIEVTGWLPRKMALEKMMESEIFLLPSRWEGLSVSLLEAMYLNRCCIVSRISGNVDVVEDGRTGYICGSFEEYIQVIDRLKENGIDEKILCAAHSYVAEEFNHEVMAKHYEELYISE